MLRTRMAVLLLALLPLGARAEGLFHRTSVDTLYGTRFDDASVGNAPADGDLLTFTFENFTEFSLGDSFLFLDASQGEFGDGPADDYHLYGEWNPRLSLSKLSGRRVGAGPLRDVLLAYEHNRGGTGFVANNLGLGLDFAVPHVAVLTLNAYWRNDNFNPGTVQLTLVWYAPFRTGPLQWSLGGFADAFRLQGGGLDLMTQPQLLLDVGALAGLPPERVKLGTEWYLHRTRGGLRHAPQAMLRLGL